MYCPTRLSNPNDSNNIYRKHLFRLTSDEIQISHCIRADFHEFIDEVSSSSFIKFWIVFIWFIKRWFLYDAHSWPCALPPFINTVFFRSAESYSIIPLHVISIRDNGVLIVLQSIFLNQLLIALDRISIPSYSKINQRK